MLSVSILGLREQLDRIVEMNQLNIDFVHIDIMDGIFVPDSFLIDENIISEIKKPLDIHLMVKDPTNYIGYFAKYKPKYITIHSEIPDADVYLNVIRNKGIGVGIAINPETDTKILERLLPNVDLVLVMSVNPGKGGQEFKNSSIGKIRRISSMCKSINPEVIIEVDGGLNKKNIVSCKEAGANMFVVGSYITTSNSYEEVVDELNKVIK